MAASYGACPATDSGREADESRACDPVERHRRRWRWPALGLVGVACVAVALRASRRGEVSASAAAAPPAAAGSPLDVNAALLRAAAHHHHSSGATATKDHVSARVDSSVTLSQPFSDCILCWLATVEVTAWDDDDGDDAAAAASGGGDASGGGASGGGGLPVEELNDHGGSVSQFEFALSYHAPNASDATGRAWLWTPAYPVTKRSGMHAVGITFCRLRLGTRYVVRTWARKGGLNKNATFHLLDEQQIVTGTLGVDQLDGGSDDFDDDTGAANAPFAQVDGGDKAAHPLVTAQHVVGGTHQTKWFGLVTVDAEGYVVWYHSFSVDTTLYSVFAQELAPPHNLVVMREVMDYDHGNYTNSELYELSPSGGVVARHRQVCEGDARSFNQLNHEVSIDDTSNEVLTLAYNIRDEYGAWTSLLALDEGLAYKWKDAHGESMAVKYVGDALVAWDRSTGETRQIYDLFDYFNPVDDALKSSVYGWIAADCVDESARAVEWLHASSAAVGADGNYLVTFRNLDMVVSLHRDGSGVQWIMTSQSGFVSQTDYPLYTLTGAHGGAGLGDDDGIAWADENARFFEPHAVHQTADGTVLLIDDGKERTNCTGVPSCFSRAVAYELNHRKQTARLVWEFEWPLNHTHGALAEESADLFSFDGGYVTYDERSGNYFTAFTAVEISDDDDAGHPAYAFEVSPGGHVVAKYRFSAVPITHKSGSYRVIPWDTVAGETLQAPWKA